MEPEVQTVVGVLEAAGFEILPSPLMVAGTRLEFDATLRGTGSSNDLIVVAGSRTDLARLTRAVSGLTRALDQLGSLRPVTLVTVGHTRKGEVFAELERQARVLCLEEANPSPAAVRQHVAVLLPLILPPTTAVGADPVREVTRHLGSSPTSEQKALLSAARFGPESVRESLRHLIDDAVKPSSGGLKS